jgi:hypothetical protein
MHMLERSSSEGGAGEAGSAGERVVGSAAEAPIRVRGACHLVLRPCFSSPLGRTSITLPLASATAPYGQTINSVFINQAPWYINTPFI